MAELTDGKKVTVVVRHGSVERTITGKAHVFEQDGETRYEVTGKWEDPSGVTEGTIGIAAENIVSVD